MLKGGSRHSLKSERTKSLESSRPRDSAPETVNEMETAVLLRKECCILPSYFRLPLVPGALRRRKRRALYIRMGAGDFSTGKWNPAKAFATLGA